MGKSSLEIGTEIEKEHKPTVEKIKSYFKEHNKFPKDIMIYEWIATDHINELGEIYYDKKVGLLAWEQGIKDMNKNVKSNKNTDLIAIDSNEFDMGIEKYVETFFYNINTKQIIWELTIDGQHAEAEIFKTLDEIPEITPAYKKELEQKISEIK